MTFVSWTQFHVERLWGQCPSRGLLRDYTTGCGTDGALHSTIPGCLERGEAAAGGDHQARGHAAV